MWYEATKTDNHCGGATRAYGYTETGIPAMRSISNSSSETVQHFEYSYAPLTGNMNWRKDNVLGYKETLTYDALNRLHTSVQEATADGYPSQYNYDHVYMGYSPNGNVTYRDNDGVLECFIDYNDSTDPYKATGWYAMGSIPDYYPEYGSIAVTSFDRPGGIMSGTGYYTTTFTYDAGGERTKMSRYESAYGICMDRYYLGGVYEKDDWHDGYTEDAERLFLGGGAYDAPMVLVKAASVNNGAWTPFNIGRDVQGSITEVLTADGEVVEQFRYDPWGLMLLEEGAVSDTLIALSPWQWAGKSVYVGGHGYTGHEHLPGFGLINCNARLYDPALGRFLMPDPLIQDPASTQNFNRYSYCLNNPLKYTDESGEFVLSATAAILISAAVFGFGNLGAHAIRHDDLGHWNWAKYFFSGAVAGAVVGATWYYATPFIRAPFEAMAGSQSWIWRLLGKQTLFNLKHAYSLMTGINFVGNLYNGIANDNGQWFNNFGKSVIGQFYLDENRTFMGQVWEGISRHTWEAFQQFFGYSWTSLRSPWNDRIDFFGGATFGTNFNVDKGLAATLGSYINIDSNESNSVINGYNSFDDYIMSKEYMADEFYTHEFGHIIQSKKWGVLYFAPALMSMWNLRKGRKIDHDHYWTETYANSYSYYYFKKHFPSYAFSKTSKPCKY